MQCFELHISFCHANEIVVVLKVTFTKMLVLTKCVPTLGFEPTRSCPQWILSSLPLTTRVKLHTPTLCKTTAYVVGICRSQTQWNRCSDLSYTFHFAMPMRLLWCSKLHSQRMCVVHKLSSVGFEPKELPPMDLKSIPLATRAKWLECAEKLAVQMCSIRIYGNSVE